MRFIVREQKLKFNMVGSISLKEKCHLKLNTMNMLGDILIEEVRIGLPPVLRYSCCGL